MRLPQYVNKFLVWHKKFGPAQKILGPVKGQGISSSENMGKTGNRPLRKKHIVSYKLILRVQIMTVCGGVLIFQRNGDLLAI